MQGAQKLRSEAHFQVRRNDEVAAQRRRWTFYETIIFKESLIDQTESSEISPTPSFLKRGIAPFCKGREGEI